jgi:peptidoglycan/LPS O-acetylase OafA/YrhL
MRHIKIKDRLMQPNTGYRAEIDGLRAVAVLAILLHHAGVAGLPGGYLGVDIFFVISGFVITRLIRAEMAAGQFSFAGFYRRRARRILPALAVLLLVCLPLGWFLMSPRQLPEFLETSIGAALMVPNVVLWGQIGYFAQDAATRPLLHLWSLGVEEQFYLLFPLLMWALWRGGASDRATRWALRGLGLISLGIAAWAVVMAPSAGFFLLPSRIWELTMGAGAALTVWSPGLRARQIWSVVGVALIAGSFLLYGPRSPGPATIPPVLGTALCLMLARGDTWVGRGLAWRPLVAVGLISYGTYLWHWPLLVFVRITLAEDPALIWRLALMTVALGLGWASWRFVEQPFRRSARPLWPRAGAGTGLATMAGIALLAGAALWAEGRGLRQMTWPGFQPDELSALNARRAVLVRDGICHLTDNTMDGDEFRAGWNCLGQPVDGAQHWPVGVFGDSIAADLSMILRETGRSPMQMTGWGCSIVPSRMRPECRAMADDFIAAAKSEGVEVVMLANLWQRGEWQEASLQELVAFWTGHFEQVVLVGPLPDFVGLEERILRLDKATLAALQPSFDASQQFLATMATIDAPGVTVIDPVPFYCADRPGCSVLSEGVPLSTDAWGHVSPHGAAIYARGLEASGVLEKILP